MFFERKRKKLPPPREIIDQFFPYSSIVNITMAHRCKFTTISSTISFLVTPYSYYSQKNIPETIDSELDSSLEKTRRKKFSFPRKKATEKLSLLASEIHERCTSESDAQRKHSDLPIKGTSSRKGREGGERERKKIRTLR